MRFPRQWPQSDHGKILLALLACALVLVPFYFFLYREELRQQRQERELLRQVLPTQIQRQLPPRSEQYDFNFDLRDRSPVKI